MVSDARLPPRFKINARLPCSTVEGLLQLAVRPLITNFPDAGICTEDSRDYDPLASIQLVFGRSTMSSRTHRRSPASTTTANITGTNPTQASTGLVRAA